MTSGTAIRPGPPHVANEHQQGIRVRHGGMPVYT